MKKRKLLLINYFLILFILPAFGQEPDKNDPAVERNKKGQEITEKINSVRSDQILKSNETNIINALNSKIPGLLITSASGAPGASASIRIRGNRSVLFDNSPLILVDGMPIDNSSFGNSPSGVDNSNRGIDLNTFDIASVSILKSTQATVIYGIRGANGVVLITTKKGMYNAKPKLNFNYGFTVDKVNKLPDLQTKYAQGRPAGGVPTWRGPDRQEGFSFGPEIADLEFDGSSYEYDNSGRLVETGFGNGIPARAYNNLDNFFINGIKHDVNLGVSGGTKMFNYYVSAGLLNQKGVVPNSDFYRKSFKVNLNSSPFKNFQAGFIFNFINSGSKNRVQRGSNVSGIPLGLFRTAATFDNGNGTSGKDAANNPDAYQFSDGRQRAYRGPVPYDNPYWSINKIPNFSEVKRIISRVSLEYQLFNNFKLSYEIGLDRWSENRLEGFDINSNGNPRGSVETDENRSTYFNSDFKIIYQKELNRDLKIDAVLGHNYFSSDFNTEKNLGTGLLVPGVFNLSNTTSFEITNSEVNQKIAGVYFNLDATLKEQLTLSISGRNDWSSVLPENKQSSRYYGIGLTYDFSKLLDNNENINVVLRNSWGKTGNRPGSYLTSNLFRPAFIGGDPFINGIQFPEYGVSGFELTQLAGNNFLKPEKTIGMETGFDLGFLKNKIRIHYTYYHNTSKDIVLNIPTSFNSGTGSIFINIGEIENKGHEIVLGITPVNKDLKWDIAMNFTKNENIVKELHETLQTVNIDGFETFTSNHVIKDQPYGAIYGRYFQRNEEGKLIIGDDGWPIAAADNKVIGNPNPDWTMGIQNSFSYKKISFGFLLDIRYGQDVWNGTSGVLNYFGISQKTADQRNITDFIFDGVTTTGSVNNKAVDFANPADGVSNYKWVRYGFGGIAEEAIQDASWIRLREVTLSYELPNKFLNKIGIEGGMLSLSARNLFLITEYTGIDPETSLTGDGQGAGLDYYNLPNTKSYNIRFNFNL